MRKDLLTEFKRSFWLAVPLIIALVAEVGMRLIDSIMMGYLGPEALAAGALSVSSYVLILVFAFGVISAVGVCMAQAIGAAHPMQLNIYFQQGFYLVLLASIPVMLIIWYMPLCFPLLKQNIGVSVLAGEYLHGTVWGAPALFGFLLLRELTTSLEKPMAIMCVALASLPLNALLDFLFIFGRGGFPALGMYGIGLASTIVQWLALIATIIYCFQVPIVRQILLVKMALPKIKIILHILSVGLPVGSVYLCEIGLFTVSAFMMGRVGVTQLAAHQIVIQCVDFAFMFVLGISQAAAIRVARTIGSKNLAGTIDVVKVSTLLALAVSTLFSILFFCFPHVLTDIFINIDHNQYSDLARYAAEFFKIAILFVLFDALQVLGNNILRGLKDTFVPVLLGVSSYWIVGIVAAYLLTFHTSLGGLGIWCGIGLGIAVSAIILWLRWFYKIRRLDALL